MIKTKTWIEVTTAKKHFVASVVDGGSRIVNTPILMAYIMNKALTPMSMMALAGGHGWEVAIP